MVHWKFSRRDSIHFTGLPMLHGDEAHKRLFGVDVQLAAEAAAHFGGDHAQVILGHAEHLRHQRAQQVRDLRRGVQRQVLFRAAVFRHHAAGFHGGRNQALAGDALLHHHLSFGERFLGVAALLVIK